MADCRFDLAIKADVEREAHLLSGDRAVAIASDSGHLVGGHDRLDALAVGEVRPSACTSRGSLEHSDNAS